MPKPKKSPQHPTQPIGAVIERPYCTQLPPEMAAPLGQVMVDWAFFEMRLQELVILALRISLAQGRLAIKSMRALEMYRLATELFLLEGIQLPKAQEDMFSELARRRNLLAHGVWLSDAGKYILRDLTGAHLIDGKKISRKVQPAGVPITPEKITELSSSIQRAVADTELIIQDVIRRRSSSAKTHPE